MSQNGKAGTIMDIIRSIFAFIDWAFFLLLGWIYEIFFSVSNAQLFSNETINAFFSRMQLIIGVFMVFKLSISVLQAIVNPDKISDKNNGFSSIITRVVMCLAMLTLLVPVNIPNARNEFDVQINNNGLLFGTLYSLQYRLLSENTVGKLVLGTKSSTSINDLKESGKNFTATLLKGFVRINMKSSNSNDYMCGDKQDIINTYNSTTDAGTVFFDLLNQKCGGWGDEKYVFAYIPLIGAITAAVFTIILIGFCADVAIRAIKLSILRLIAPIPIIAYLDPNQEKKGAFANWVKMLTSTYLDLFIRLAIVYFVIFLIQDIMANGLIINTGSGITGFITFVIICIGLFLFAKQAPKFIKDALGLQNTLSNVGLASILGGAAMAVGGGGLAGFGYGAINGAKAQIDGQANGKPVPLGSAWSQNSDLMAKIRTGDKDAQGGLFGRAQDMMNYKTRDNAAARLNMSSTDLAQAKYAKDLADERVMDTQRSLDFALQELNNSDPADRNEKMRLYQQAYKAHEEAQGAAAKAGKIADQIEKSRGQMGVAPRIVDTKQESYRSAKKVKTANRYYDAQGNPVNSSALSSADEAVFSSNNNYTVYERAVDSSGNFVDSHLENAAYKNDVKNFSGITDDSPFSGSRGTGAPGSGGPGGPPPGPPPGPRP